jgi:hypothetical protein
MAPKPNIPPPSYIYLRQKQRGYQPLQEDVAPTKPAQVLRARVRGPRVAAVEEIPLDASEAARAKARSRAALRNSAEGLVLRGVAACGQVCAARVALHCRRRKPARAPPWPTHPHPTRVALPPRLFPAQRMLIAAMRISLVALLFLGARCPRTRCPRCGRSQADDSGGS